MARKYDFLVTLSVSDEDQTDPDDIVDVLKGVLEGQHAANWAWVNGIDEMIPEARPKFEIKHLPFGAMEIKVKIKEDQ